MSRTICLVNGTIITPYRQINASCIILKGSTIQSICSSLPEELLVTRVVKLSDRDLAPRLKGDESPLIVDVEGAIIVPGFIDVHLHGAGGYDIMDGGIEPIIQVAVAHAKGGTTSILPTTISCSSPRLMEVIHDVRKVMNLKTVGAQVLILHIEGTYLHLKQRGAHDLSQVRNPDPAEYMEWIENTDVVKLMTIAPELPGALEVAQELSERSIVASMGHTTVEFEHVQKAIEAGFTHVTHYLCSISQTERLSDRKIAGLAEAALVYEDLSVELIADNMHLPPGIPQMVHKVKGPSKTILVTDAMRAAGMGEGEYYLGDDVSGQKVIVDQGVAWVPDRSVFAGSVAMANVMIKNVVEYSMTPLAEAVQMMTSSPARLLNLKKKGVLAAGMDADLAILTPELDVFCTIVNGDVVHINNDVKDGLAFEAI